MNDDLHRERECSSPPRSLEGQGPNIECAVRNISDSGARLQVQRATAFHHF